MLLVHVGALILIALTPLTWLTRLSIWLLLGWSLYWSLRTHAWRQGPLAIEVVELDGEGTLAVRLAGSEIWHAARINARFVHPWLTLLSLRLENRRWPVSLVIAADAVEPEPFRRWRARLKFQTVAA